MMFNAPCCLLRLGERALPTSTCFPLFNHLPMTSNDGLTLTTFTIAATSSQHSWNLTDERLLGGFYGGNGLAGNAGMGYHFQGGNPSGYQGHSQGGGAYYGGPATQAASHYGQVNYYVTHANEAGHARFPQKPIGELTLNELLGKVQDNSLNLSDYMSFAPLLSQLQLPLPVTSPGTAEYAAARHGSNYGNGNTHYGNDHPVLPGIHSKQDLLKVKSAIEQMTHTANAMGSNSSLYEAQRNGHRRHVSLHPLAATNQLDAAGNATHMSSPTPSLTPAGSSAVSNTSGHSPASSHSQTVSPVSGGMHLDASTASTMAGMQATHATSGPYSDLYMAQHTPRTGYASSGAMYPNLSSAATSAGMSAPVPVLGSSLDMRRRHSGSRLYAGQPERPSPPTDGDADMAVSSPRAGAPDLVIDPALDPALAGPSRGSSSGSATPTPASPAVTPETIWNDNMRKLEALKQIIEARLQLDEADENDIKQPAHEDEVSGESKNDDEMDVDSAEREEESLYPKISA